MIPIPVPEPRDDPPEAQTPAPRVRELSVDNGRALPVAYGLVRLQGQVIWQGNTRRNPVPGDKVEYYVPVAIGLCEGPITGVRRVWCDDEVGNNTPDSGRPADWHSTIPRFGFEVNAGTWGQAASTELAGLETFRWSGTAYVAHRDFWLREKNTLPTNMTFEVEALFMDGATLCASPADVLYDLLTHPRRGAGLDPSKIDADSLDAYRAYCAAAGLGISWVLDAQTSLIEHIRTLLDATNAELYWSWNADGTAGAFRVVVLSDQPVLDATGAVVWSPPTVPEYDLVVDDFKGDGDPIVVEQAPDADTYNSYPIEYIDRSMGYVASTVADDDVVDVRTYELNRAPVTALHCLADAGAAQMISRLKAQRATRCRNQYRFTLDWRHARIERGDIVTLTDEVFGLAATPARVVAVDEAAEGLLEITAIDWPPGVSAAARWGTQAGDGSGPALEADLTGAREPTMFLGPRANDGTRYAWIASSGDETFGGCVVYTSWDGDWTEAGRIAAGACAYGVLASSLASAASGVDATNHAQVTLTSGTLPAVSVAERDALTSACWVDGEVIAYSASTGSAPVDLSALRRGVNGTTPSAHDAGSPFVRMDAGPVRVVVPDSRIGQTLHVKLCAYNATDTVRIPFADAVEYTLPIGVGWGPVDRKLTPSEKTSLLITYKEIVSSRAVFDGQADAYGISRTSFDAAVGGLISCMTGLGLLLGSPYDSGPSNETTWVTTVTDVDDATIRAAFAGAYAARQALQQALSDALKTIVDGVKNRLPLTITWDAFNAGNWWLANPGLNLPGADGDGTMTADDAYIGHDLPCPFGGFA